MSGVTPEREEEILREHRHGIMDVLLEDLDSAYTADIACCEKCYEEFIKMWPLAKAELDQNAVDLKKFYDTGKRLQYLSREEYEVLVKYEHCPRCLSFLNEILYAYNLPFSMPKHFEFGIEEIVDISSTTPFLVLDHPLAREIFDKINEAAKIVTPSLAGTNYFRARPISGMKALNEIEFHKPPRSIVKEGRYNHAGEPMLYLGNSIETCFAELRNVICFIAHINIRNPMRVLDLSDTWVSHREISDALDAITYSALISAKNDSDGWHKPEYKFSRFIADCAKAAGFDCIKYPSTRLTADSHNLVIINPALDIDKIGAVLHYFLYDGKHTNELSIT